MGSLHAAGMLSAAVQTCVGSAARASRVARPMRPGLNHDVDREERASGPRYLAPAGVRRRPLSAKVAQHYATAAQPNAHRALPTLTRNSLPETGDSARRASRGAEARDWARSPGSVPALRLPRRISPTEMILSVI